MTNDDHNEEKLDAIETIKKKLTGKELNYDEILNLMDSIAKKRLGTILETYFAAAGFSEGFTDEELFYLTKAMVETGNKLKFSGIVADKHSIGGLAGTRTTLIVVPIIAAAGFKIPKISSRAITTPAGTADVMECLCRVTFEKEQVEKMVNEIGGCIIWNDKMGIAPADDELIRIEAPIGIESYDKFIVSIMAKKIAAGATHLVLDIPVGPTMKIRHEKDVKVVVEKFQMIADKFGIKLDPYVNQAKEPAGAGIGPFLEAFDSIQVLEQLPNRAFKLEEKAIQLAGRLLNLCYKDAHVKKDGFDEAKKILQSGEALKKFRQIVQAQGGRYDVSSLGLLDPMQSRPLLSDRSGIVTDVNNYHINTLAKILGAPKDKQAGIYILKKIGEPITKGEPLANLYAHDTYHIREAIETAKDFPLFEIK